MASRSDTTAAADAPADSVATTLSSASFVCVHCSADGDGLAAAGLLARALRRVDVPFQVRVASVRTAPPVSDDGLSVSVGSEYPGADLAVAPDDAPASLAAYRIAADIGGGDESAPDPVIALAGVVAGGAHPESVAGSLVETASEAGQLVRRPGVATPVTDPIDGLAHSTLLHAPFSGESEATAAALSAVSVSESDDGGRLADDDAADTRRSIASCVALAIASDGDAPPHAADATERVLRPYATPDAPVATLGGFAEVLTAAARERPGTGVALVLGHGGRDAAVDAWREHGAAVHNALGPAPTARHDGVFVVRAGEESAVADAPGRLATLARLARDFRSPEPLVVALGTGVAAVSARESGASDAAATLVAEFPATDGTWTGGPTRALARIDPDAPVPELVAAIRGRSA
jgi:hypothetical protein